MTHSPSQKPVLDAMADPAFYPHPVESVERRETHISHVFLAGERVYKVKKPVEMGFLDFSTLSRRRFYCRREVALNRRLAPDIYKSVTAITSDNGAYRLEGAGEAVEYAVRMRRLPDHCALHRRLARGPLTEKEIKSLGRLLADFYLKADSAPIRSDLGTWAVVRRNCRENFEQTSPYLDDPLDPDLSRLIEEATHSFLDRNRALFHRRSAEDRIRNCHGDLRAGHIYFDGRFHIIDCIEFNRRFRYHDVASDLAFLAMDLDDLGHGAIGAGIVEACAAHLGDGDLFLLIDFYKCYRAMVRCKVACFQIKGAAADAEEKERRTEDARRFLSLAGDYARRFSRPTLWAVCGLPGSGKSTLARRLAQAMDRPVLRTDLIRKELFEEKAEGRPDKGYGEGIYSPQARSLTYGRMLGNALDTLKAHRDVILDATFGDQKDRQEACRLAGDTGARILFLECVAPAGELEARLRHRESTPTVSDARIHHLDKIRNAFDPMTDLPPGTHIRADTGRAPEAVYRQVLSEYHRLLSCPPGSPSKS